MDPDNDGFIISFEDAEKFNKNMNILHFIRRYIISNSGKLFMSGLKSLIESSKINNNKDSDNLNSNNNNYFIPYMGNLPENWNFSQHDKGILNAVADNGLNFLNQISYNPNYNFNKIKISFEDAIDRVNYLCEFFRDFSSSNKNKKKNLNISINLNNINDYNLNLNESENLNINAKEGIKDNSIDIGNSIGNININKNIISNMIMDFNNNINGNLRESNNPPIKNPIKNNTNMVEIPIMQNSSINKSVDYRRKNNKFFVKRDDNGNIIYPIFINSSLQILNLGEIVYDKISFHSEKNLFPVGFKSIREHSSMFKLGERTQYICEILNGGTKPLYKLTPIDNPENPIIKESSTGCWVIFLNKISSLNFLSYKIL
jgi:hypothetical protein